MNDGSLGSLFVDYDVNRPIDGSSGVPTLHALCLRFIMTTVINNENAPSVVDFANTYNCASLRDKALVFMRKSFPALRDLHPRADLLTAFGAEELAALEKEQDALDAKVQRNKMVGSIIDTPAAKLPAWEAAAAIEKKQAPPSSAGAAASTTATPRKRFSFVGGGGEKCHSCSKTVYPAEKVAAHEKCWHISCFRCSDCSTKLAVHNFEITDAGKLYCKTHFKQLWLKSRRDSTTANITAPPPSSEPPPLTPDVSDPTATATAAPPPFPSGARAFIDPGGSNLIDWVHANTDRCARCGKKVYQYERMSARAPAPKVHLQEPTLQAPVFDGGNFAPAQRFTRGRVIEDGELLCFHKVCFKCADCGTSLRESNWELDESSLLCRVHYQARRNARGGEASF